MRRTEKIIINGIFILFTVNVLVPATVLAVDDVSQYGLGAEGLARFTEKPSALDFAKDFQSNSVEQNKKNSLITPSLLIDIDYRDKPADFLSPFHSFNTDLNNNPNNTSNEFKTRMGYRFNYLHPEASFIYSPDSYGLGKYYNYELGISVPIKNILSLETRYGWNQFDKKIEKGGVNNYEDWSIGVSTSYKGVKLKVDYIDINASEKSEECCQTCPCEGKTVFSIIKNF